MDLLPKNVPKSRVEGPWARSCDGLGLSRAPLGWLLDALGGLLGALGRVLGASWASLGHTWVSPGCQLLPKRGPDSTSEGSWSVRGRVGGPKAVFFMGFSYISLYNAFNSAVTTLLHFPTLFLLTFWCGGLCTAHGIRGPYAWSMRAVPFWAYLGTALGPHVGSFLAPLTFPSLSYRHILLLLASPSLLL